MSEVRSFLDALLFGLLVGICVAGTWVGLDLLGNGVKAASHYAIVLCAAAAGSSVAALWLEDRAP